MQQVQLQQQQQNVNVSGAVDSEYECEYEYEYETDTMPLCPAPFRLNRLLLKRTEISVSANIKQMQRESSTNLSSQEFRTGDGGKMRQNDVWAQWIKLTNTGHQGYF